MLAAAQLLFAAHAGAASEDISDHATQTCEFCLAGAIAADPEDLAVRLTAPDLSFAAAARPVAAEILVAIALIAAPPRGPPLA